MKKVFLVLLVLFTSGCIVCDTEFKDLADSFGLCEGNGATPMPTARDVLTIEEKVYPSTTIRTGESVDFILKVGYNGEKDKIVINEASLFDKCEGAVFSKGVVNPQKNKEIRQGLYDTFEWNVDMSKVPGNTVCSLSYQVKYGDVATTIEYLDVYGYDEYYQRKARGESVTSTAQTYKSAGPVEVEIDTGSEPYIVPEKNVGSKKIYVTVKKVGKGMLKGSKVNKLTIIAPPGYKIDGQDEKTEEQVPVYGDASERFSMVLTRNSTDVIYEQVPIKVVATYDYEYRGSVDITVKP